MASSVLAPAAVDYPSSDGSPVAESDFQLTPILYARDALRDYFRDRPDVYVAANLFIYYQEGNREAVVAPDVFVVLGAPNHDRHTYRLWEEQHKVPDFVLEVTSRRTWQEDQGRKRELYRSLGVAEYWQYDPTGDYLQPRLQGLHLVAGEYRRMAARTSAEDGLSISSSVLGLELRISERGLRFHDPATGEDVPSLAERREAWEREQRARERAERGWQRAEQERQRAEQERQREREARQQAEARLAELEALLREQRGRDSEHRE